MFTEPEPKLPLLRRLAECQSGLYLYIGGAPISADQARQMVATYESLSPTDQEAFAADLHRRASKPLMFSMSRNAPPPSQLLSGLAIPSLDGMLGLLAGFAGHVLKMAGLPEGSYPTEKLIIPGQAPTILQSEVKLIVPPGCDYYEKRDEAEVDDLADRLKAAIQRAGVQADHGS